MTKSRKLTVEQMQQAKNWDAEFKKRPQGKIMWLAVYNYIMNGRRDGAKAYNAALEEIGKPPIKPRSASVQFCKFKTERPEEWQEYLSYWTGVLEEHMSENARQDLEQTCLNVLGFNLADYFDSGGRLNFSALRENSKGSIAITEMDVTFYPGPDGQENEQQIKRVKIGKANPVHVLQLFAKIMGYEAPQEIKHSAEESLIEWLSAPLPADPVPEKESGGK